MATIAVQKIIGNGSKECRRCHRVKDFSEFYVRPTYGTLGKPAIIDGHFNSECKECLKSRSVTQIRTVPWESTILSEQLAIDYLMSKGIWTQTGKATTAPDVDLVSWGCVWLEVKHSRLEMETGGRSNRFKFVCTPSQIQRSFLAHVVMLICEYNPSRLTYHLFHSDAPFFYKEDGTLKTGITFTPDELRRSQSGRLGHNPLTQEAMDAAQDNIGLIEQWRCWIANDLSEGERPTYGKPFAR